MPERGARGEGSLYERQDGRWVATVFLGYHVGTGQRLRKYFYGASQREVVRKRKQYLRDLEDGVASSSQTRGPKAWTVGDWLDHWLEHVIGPDRERTTYDSYEVLIRLHLKPYIGQVPLRSLETAHVEALLRDLARKGVGLRTRQVALARLRTALNVALRRRQETGLRSNPATLVEMPRSASRHVEPPNMAHARALLDAARGDRLEAFVTVGLALGLRRGEITGLRWEDVDLEARTLVVRRRVSRVKGALLVREGRKMHPDAGGQTVALPELMCQALRAHRSRQIGERLRAGERWKGEEPTQGGLPAGYVFASTIGTVLEPRNVFRSFEAMRTKAGLDEKTFHQLRHDCASLLLAQGVPMYAVSQILRHSSPTITARFYAHLTPELQREAAAEMDKVLRSLLPHG